MRVKPPDFAFFRRKKTQSRAFYPLQCSLQLATGMLRLFIKIRIFVILSVNFYVPIFKSPPTPLKAKLLKLLVSVPRAKFLHKFFW